MKAREKKWDFEKLLRNKEVRRYIPTYDIDYDHYKANLVAKRYTRIWH